MAINPNFVFQDPRVQQGVVQMAQIAAAEEAARLQRQAQSQQSFTQAQVARDNATAERARNDAYLNQREREAARSDVTLNKDLDLRRQVLEGRVGNKDTARAANAQYNTLNQLSLDANDPPTPREWTGHLETYGKDLTDDEKNTLKIQWQRTRDAAVGRAKTAAVIEAEVNKSLDGLDKISRSEAIKKALKDYDFLRVGGAGVLHTVRIPREDKDILGPPVPPQGILPTPTAGIRSIEEIPRSRTPVAGGGFFGFDPSAVSAFSDFGQNAPTAPPPPPFIGPPAPFLGPPTPAVNPYSFERYYGKPETAGDFGGRVVRVSDILGHLRNLNNLPGYEPMAGPYGFRDRPIGAPVQFVPPPDLTPVFGPPPSFVGPPAPEYGPPAPFLGPPYTPQTRRSPFYPRQGSWKVPTLPQSFYPQPAL